MTLSMLGRVAAYDKRRHSRVLICTKLAPAQHQGWQEIHSNWDTISSMPPRYGTEHLDRRSHRAGICRLMYGVSRRKAKALPKKSGTAVRRPVSRSKAENYRIAVFGLATTGVCNYLARG